MKKSALLSAILFVVMVISSACIQGPEEYGLLEGQVIIGPLVPVLRDGEQSPTPNPEVYAAREIVVYKQNGKTEFTRLGIDPNGHYEVELPVGVYVIDINRIGIDRADNLPLEITIHPNKITTLDIDIDTGIE